MTKLPPDIGFILVTEIPMSLFNYEYVTRRMWSITKTEDEPDSERLLTGLDVSGNSTTDAHGQYSWRLSKFASPPLDLSTWKLKDPMSFVATPVTDKPTFLTITLKKDSTIHLNMPMDDLVSQIFSWDIQGNPAPNTRFCWRCRLKAIGLPA